MNAQLQELVKQATVSVNNPTLNSDGAVVFDNWEEMVSLEKFARLIVEQCALQCNHNSDMDLILKHFGLEL